MFPKPQASTNPREGSGRAAGELREHHRRIRIGGGCRLGREPAGAYGGDRFNLFVQQPADLIDLMNAHVDRDPAAASPEGSRWRLLIPLHAGQLVDLSKLTGFNPGPESPQHRHEPPPIPDLKHNIGPQGRIAGCGGLLGRHPHRLLAEHRDAGRSKLPDEHGVHARWGGDQHRLCGTGGDQLLRRCERRHTVVPELRAYGVDRLDDPGQ